MRNKKFASILIVEYSKNINKIQKGGEERCQFKKQKYHKT